MTSKLFKWHNNPKDVCAPSNRASKYMKQKLIELQKEKDKSTKSHIFQ